MMKKYYIIALLVLSFVLPRALDAMTLQIEKPVADVRVGDTVLLGVYVDTEDQEINAIDGSITLEGNYEVRTVSVAGSIFDVWANKPSIEGNKITFVGGSTAGVFGSRLKVLSIAVKPLDSEGIQFSSQDAKVFLNDGVGTAVTAEGVSKQIFVAQGTDATPRNELEELILEDKTQPESFDVIVGQDFDTFEGKYFASFNAVDAGSGVNRYEVIEEGYPAVRSGNTYVLRNQDLSGTLIVKAVDNAGNVRTVEVKVRDVVSESNSINWFAVIVASLVLLLIFYAKKFFKRKREARVQ